MVYLNDGIFKPALIMVSILLLPISVACSILTILDFRIELFIASFLMVLSYVVAIIAIYKYSKAQKHYLFVADNVLVINYPNLNSKIHLSSVVKIEYYKISSIKAWCMLYNYVCPQCAYITYVDNGKEVCKHIGYPKFNRISELCTNVGLNLVIK